MVYARAHRGTPQFCRGGPFGRFGRARETLVVVRLVAVRGVVGGSFQRLERDPSLGFAERVSFDAGVVLVVPRGLYYSRMPLIVGGCSQFETKGLKAPSDCSSTTIKELKTHKRFQASTGVYNVQADMSELKTHKRFQARTWVYKRIS